MGLTQLQSLSIVILVKCTAPFSIVGSSWIAKEVLSDPKKRSMVYHRLLLAMSISDIICSAWLFVGNWAIPVGTAGVFMPRGNQISCNTQGFFVQLGIMTPLYNAGLSLYYLLIINYGWKEASLRRIEPFFHLLSLIWGFGTSIGGLVYGQYNNSNLWCWLSSTPQSKVLRWALYYGPVWTVLVFVTVAMLMVVRNVRMQEKQLDKYDFKCKSAKQQNREMKNRKHTKRVAVQSFWYVFAFYLSFIFASLTRLIQTINGKTYYPLLLLFAIFFPMQGFMNFLVYMRPKYIQRLKKKKSKRQKITNGTAVTSNLTAFKVSAMPSMKSSNISSASDADIEEPSCSSVGSGGKDNSNSNNNNNNTNNVTGKGLSIIFESNREYMQSSSTFSLATPLVTTTLQPTSKDPSSQSVHRGEDTNEEEEKTEDLMYSPYSTTHVLGSSSASALHSCRPSSADCPPVISEEEGNESSSFIVTEEKDNKNNDDNFDKAIIMTSPQSGKNQSIVTNTTTTLSTATKILEQLETHDDDDDSDYDNFDGSGINFDFQDEEEEKQKSPSSSSSTNNNNYDNNGEVRGKNYEIYIISSASSDANAQDCDYMYFM